MHEFPGICLSFKQILPRVDLSKKHIETAA